MAFVPLSLQTILRDGEPVYGARVFAVNAGTSTPRALFRTSALNAAQQHPRPVIVGADGAFPVMFAGLGDYDLIVRDPNDSTIKTILGLPGDPKPDAPTDDAFDLLRQIPTGALVPMLSTGRRSGYVRANGLRIGSAASDADERNNEDTRALFTLRWEAGAAVIGGRGASANADFDAAKTIALPDHQNRALVGLSNMGNAGAAPSLTGGLVDGGTITVGSKGGAAAHTLTTAQLADHLHGASFAGVKVDPHDHSVAVSSAPAHQHPYVTAQQFTGTAGSGAEVTGLWVGTRNGDSGLGGGSTPTVTEQQAGGHTPSGAVTVAGAGGGQAHNNLQPFVGAMIYIKL